ncbi:alpha-keto acid decarboxylase family protein [Alkalicoccus urumqiensis]|uniref:Alpha-keto-acid decarboxylase n=1 Tax=Alkalicoccus urumqiensis TaxID=1548213 RepID=A0A2P6MJ78_ALKUR|nr:thiamine pyrophosphate-binding protein [Alkalicoccus urumqiensis]PRO66331.1 thiamine pyrophosphate-binding protein [Alkalicoccus urumqiensis]
MKTTTVKAWLFDCIRDAGIKIVFGLPGDYNFGLCDEIETREDLRMMHMRNELNAGYAADGYARATGAAAMITTYGVGDLSAVNATAGAFSESVPLIHVVGSPDSDVLEDGKLVHHSLMNGDTDAYLRMHEPITAAAERITAETAAETIPRLIDLALTERKPVYIEVPQDTADAEITLTGPEEKQEVENVDSWWAADAVHKAVEEAERPVLLVDVGVSRFLQEEAVLQFSRVYQLPTYQTMQGKSAFPEDEPQYGGVYGAAFGPEYIRKQVEEADVIVTAGLLLSDFNTSKFQAELDENKRIDLQPDHTMLFGERIDQALMTDVLRELGKRESARGKVELETPKLVKHSAKNQRLSSTVYYPILEEALPKGGILTVDTGSFSYGMPYVKLPEGCRMFSQGSWQSIGYALPAAVGAAAAEPETPVWCMIGDGALQLTVQELSTMHVEKMAVKIFILNNLGYAVERRLHPGRPHADYNDIPLWDYAAVTAAFAPGAVVDRAETAGELEDVLAKQVDGLHVIELVVDDEMDVPFHLQNLSESIEE